MMRPGLYCVSIAAMAVINAALGAAQGSASPAPTRGAAPHYDRVHTLTPREGVFAYARIAPDGRRLVYSSQVRNERGWTVTVVDLPTRRTLFSDGGIDAYWSNDGARIIYSGSEGVTVRNLETGATTATPAASGLGDYFSWAVRNGRDLILTIQGNYYYLDRDKPVLPAAVVPRCDGIGGASRPLISHDGRRITTFVEGNLVVRGLDHCNDIIDVGIQGSKADFSWDGRYIAFHAVKPDATGYEIRIVDLEQRTVRTLPGLAGSALFPSWTRDGRLCFRYDGPDYRGFIMASRVLDVRAEPWPSAPQPLPQRRTWSDIFPETPAEPNGVQLVFIWAPWSAHSLEGFTGLQQARDEFVREGVNVKVMAAADPGSRESDITRQLADFQVSVPRIRLSQRGLALTEARNQMPTLLLFRDGVLVDARLGAQSVQAVRDWVLPFSR